MLIPNQIVELKWTGQIRLHYESLGYEYTGYLQPFKVKAEDLSKGCHAKVITKCDYCGKEKIKEYCSYFREHDNILGDCCKKCKTIKQKATNMERYGVTIALKRKDIQQKRIQTNMKKYGCASPTQNIDIINKTKQTCRKRYGGNSSMSSQKVLEKYKQTCMERYGVPFASQNPIIKEKTIRTLMKTINENGTIPTSKPERAMCDILIDMFGVEKCHPSFLYDKIIMDCMLEIDNLKLDIEYDGIYWHSKKLHKDMKRDYWVKSQGFKIIRVKSGSKVPTREQLQDAIDYLRETNHSQVEILLNI